MCGIVALVSSRSEVDPTLAAAMCATLRHRGPDDHGVWHSPDRRVALAQQRLAVIDLSATGHQPMCDGTGAIWITFNGEIYNHRELRAELQSSGTVFRGTSDTEVLIEAYRTWGEAGLGRLNGMFAFVLYDTQRKRVVAARDRAGEKPLFYRHTAGHLAFASELKALLHDPSVSRVLDRKALEFYLAYGYVPGDLCLLQGIRKLPAAHLLTFDLDHELVDVREYWKLPDPPGLDAAVSMDEAVATVDALLQDAVRRQMVADVPVAVLLSGGLDSSLVTAMAARSASRPIRTFTMGFPGHADHDERKYARMVASHFGTDHVELAAEPESVDLLPLLARQYDEPLADSSMLPMYLLSKLVRSYATVALGGDGADELFGGYKHYSWVQAHAAARRWMPPLARRIVAGAARRLPVGVRGRHYAVELGGGDAGGAQVNVYFDTDARGRLLAPAGERSAEHRCAPEMYRASLVTPGASLLRRLTEVDFRTMLSDGYLVKVDRASMLNSLEVRAPWLDVRLIEFAFGRLPDALRATTSARKIVLRTLAAKLLPAELDVTRKQGFSIPLHKWFKGNWGEYMESVLRSADPRLFDRGMIDRLIAGQRRGLANSARLFALTMFELWRREYRVDVA